MQSVEGGRLYFTLIGDAFIDTLGQTVSTDDACTGTLIDQLTLAPGGVPQPLGWEAVVQATLRSKLDTVVVRESRDSLLIQLPQLLIYKLSLAETITAAIPGACLESGNALQEQHIDSAPFRVLPAVGRAYLSGSLLTQAFESTVQTSSSQLLITVQDDSLSVDRVEPLVPSIISGSLGAAPGSWMSIVQASLSASAVAIATQASGFDITIDIPPNPAFAISQPETVQVMQPSLIPLLPCPAPYPPSACHSHVLRSVFDEPPEPQFACAKQTRRSSYQHRCLVPSSRSLRRPPL